MKLSSLASLGFFTLALVAIALSAFFYIQLKNTSADLNHAQQALSQETSRLNQIQLELTSTKDKLSKLESTQADTASALEKTKANLEKANQEKADLEKSKSDLQSQLSQAKSDIAKLSIENRRLICDENLDMDYSGVMAATSRLMSFVDGLPDTEHISTGFRNTLWSNADSKIYGIRYVSEDGETYARQFLVYFNELGFTPAVFYVDGQCWLDVP
jgi:predicted nuclease with TOPRIM domain